MNLLGWDAPLILALATAMIPRFSKATDPIPISLRVWDYVNLPRNARAELQVSTMRILGQARIRVDFVECYADSVETTKASCRAPLGPNDLVLRIFRPALAMRGEQLGYAAMTEDGGGYLTVFVDPASRRARARNLSDGALLGHAVAHEVGHLLLGADSHTSSGIMRPIMREVDEEWMARGWLVFSADQARRMRANLGARIQPRITVPMVDKTKRLEATESRLLSEIPYSSDREAGLADSRKVGIR